jgi:hypothetical protein
MDPRIVFGHYLRRGPTWIPASFLAIICGGDPHGSPHRFWPLSAEEINSIIKVSQPNHGLICDGQLAVGHNRLEVKTREGRAIASNLQYFKCRPCSNELERGL